MLACVPFLGHAAPPPYAPAPNDNYWNEQWYLENLDTNAMRHGVDMNAREAWGISRGEGITIAIVDNGVELHHPDLTNNAAADLHWNFETDTPDGSHKIPSHNHGTAVAGLAAAEGGNGLGVTGIAPEAKFASWVIFNTNTSSGLFVSTNQLARMFEFDIERVQVQNHSWNKPGPALVPLSLPERLAISNAVLHGRGGKGVVMVHAAGNDRARPDRANNLGRDVNEDERVSSPLGIAVAAVGSAGRVASYSNMGAAILVSAISGDTYNGYYNLFTTDRLGSLGMNQISFDSDLADYVWGVFGFSGTSAAAPLVSGTAALILSANPDLHYRDVQQIMAIASRQTDLADPHMQENGAGLLISPNTGYGLLDAGRAVTLARDWVSRPPLTSVTYTSTEEKDVPDAGLRLHAHIAGAAEPFQPITALPGLGTYPDEPTPVLPLVFIGLATEPLELDLTGKAALIARGDATFSTKIRHAAEAGAAFAVIHNNVDGDRLNFLGGTDFVPIPSFSITENDGHYLRAFLTNGTPVQGSLALERAVYEFDVAETLLTEHVQVRVKSDHPLRGDMRITLVSPQGTRSVLQRLGNDTSPGPLDWTYTSTHHFFEASAGVWKIEFSDVVSENAGAVQFVSLHILGTPITDSDRDGLDDGWEAAQFGGLASNPSEDTDGDGLSNAIEQVLQTPAAEPVPAFGAALASWRPGIVRLAWEAAPGAEYEIYGGTAVDGPLNLITNIIPDKPNAAWFGTAEGPRQFYRVLRK